MNKRLAMMALVLLAISGMGAEPAEDGDLGKLQGAWEASVGKKKEIAVTLEIKGHDVAAMIKPKIGPKVKASGELQLDEAASPRSLDWVNFSTLDGQEVPKLLSIYRLEGDKLYVRSGGFNDVRPKAFEKGGEGIWTDVLVFTRPVAGKTVTSNP